MKVGLRPTSIQNEVSYAPEVELKEGVFETCTLCINDNIILLNDKSLYRERYLNEYEWSALIMS